MKKLTTAKYGSLQQVSLDGQCCPESFQTGLCIFISQMKPPSARGRTYLFHRDWWCLAFSLLSEESQPSGEFLMLLQIL